MDIHWGYCTMDPCTCRAERMTGCIEHWSQAREETLRARVKALETQVAELMETHEYNRTMDIECADRGE